MRYIPCLVACSLAFLLPSVGTAAEITGDYLEARTCDVYTGPCFANGEMGLAGKEAIMAWKVDEGNWNGVSLSGLSAALVVKSEGTLGDDGVFAMDAGHVRSVILVDERATDQQRQAFVAFVKQEAKELTQDVIKVESVPVSLENDHVLNKGVLTAGKIARIETRELSKTDCVCTNEVIYYLPLTKVDNFSPAYSETLLFKGEGLDATWNNSGQRSAFLATFSR